MRLELNHLEHAAHLVPGELYHIVTMVNPNVPDQYFFGANILSIDGRRTIVEIDSNDILMFLERKSIETKYDTFFEVKQIISVIDFLQGNQIISIPLVSSSMQYLRYVNLKHLRRWRT